MSAQSGRTFLLQMQMATGEYLDIAGQRTTGFTLDNEPVDITNKSSNRYRTLLEAGGTRSITVAASGVFVDDAALSALQDIAFNDTLANLRLIFEDGSTISGEFQINTLEKAGEYNGEVTYSLTIQSSGQFTFVGA